MNMTHATGTGDSHGPRATLAQALQKDGPSIVGGARHEEGRCKL
jgi:hypothetical protein